jgi:hypothetical protein
MEEQYSPGKARLTAIATLRKRTPPPGECWNAVLANEEEYAGDLAGMLPGLHAAPRARA